MNVPDFDKTSALIRSSAESANSMSVVGVSPVSIVMGGGPVDGIGTSISNCGIFTALDFRSLYLNNFFFDFFFQFWCRSAFQTPIFTKIVFNFCTHKWTRAGVCAWTSVWVYRRFVCYVLRATQNFHENLSHLYIAALFILRNTHTFNVRFFLLTLAANDWITSHHRSIYIMIVCPDCIDLKNLTTQSLSCEFNWPWVHSVKFTVHILQSA